MNRIIYFIKYHNAVPIILGAVLLATAGAFANEDVRNAVLGEKIVSEKGIDNSQILAADLDNFDLVLKVQNVTQDGENYYINYIFRTLAIKDNVWQEAIKQNTLTVDMKSMEGMDLGLYVQGELAEVADWELNYLKRVQADEKEKGITKLTASVDYTGLIGLVLDARDKILPGYKPVITKEICDSLDNNKNGMIDEEFKVGEICITGNGVCQREGIYTCSSAGESACSAIPGTPGLEICDGLDNNCDGQVDEAGICTPPAAPEGGEPRLKPGREQPQPQPEPIFNPPTELIPTTTEATTTQETATTTQEIIPPPQETATTTEATTTEPVAEQPLVAEEPLVKPATTTEATTTEPVAEQPLVAEEPLVKPATTTEEHQY